MPLQNGKKISGCEAFDWAKAHSINLLKSKDNDYENNVRKRQEGLEGISWELHERHGNLWRGFEQKPWMRLRLKT